MNHPMLLLGKCLQTPRQEPALVWPVKKSESVRFLVVAAHPRNFGVSLVAVKPADATASGNLASVCRTWGDTLAVKAIWHDRVQRAWWIPIGGNLSEPKAYVHLSGGGSPEISLIEVSPAGSGPSTIRMRMGTAGIFTKRRDFEGVLPHEMESSERDAALEDLLGRLLSGPAVEATREAEKSMLPLHQRQARDRVARRVKTLRKALSQQEKLMPSSAAIDEARGHAFALQARGASESGDAGEGQAIDKAFKELKRLENAAAISHEKAAAARKALLAAESALEKLRSGPLGESEINDLFARTGIKQAAPARTSRAGNKKVQPEAVPWMTIRMGDGTAILVGKGAQENDELVKFAASNDWWFHAVGVTGSHVIVPARQFKGVSELPAHLIRAAGILALHYSKNRANKGGEVYVTRKAHLRKRKGDPAGLWQIERSSSVMIRYSDEDLSALLV